MVPSYLATSPIMSDGAILISASLMSNKSCGLTVQSLGAGGTAGENGSGAMMKKRRKRRRKAAWADSVWREESGEYSGEEDMFTIDISSDEERAMETSR